MILIESKSYVNAKDLIGRNPVYFAIKNKKVHVVRELLRRFGNPWSIPGQQKYEILSEGVPEIMQMIAVCRAVSLVSNCRLISNERLRQTVNEGALGKKLLSIL